MPAIPDVSVYAEFAGWALAVFVVVSVLGMVITGHLVPKAPYEREIRRADALDARLDEVTKLLGELSGFVKGLADARRTR